ncbi:unnamed protein product, partial [Laminaria digitata]
YNVRLGIFVFAFYPWWVSSRLLCCPVRLCPSSKVTLVAPSSSLKAVRDVEQITPLVAVVDVRNRSAEEFALEHPGISLVCSEVTRVDADQNEAKLASGGSIAFDRCCLATGASPSLSYTHPRVIGIRDNESVANLSKQLADARRVLIVGNGGIALELVQALTSAQACQIVWAVRDAYVGNTFFDPNASAFLLPSLSAYGKSREAPIPSKNSPPSPPPSRAAAFCGASLGPAWLKTLNIAAYRGSSTRQEDTEECRQQPLLDIQFECELDDVRDGKGSEINDGPHWPVSATLTNGVVVDCDFVISATGAKPNTNALGDQFERGHDGGFVVDERMRVVHSCGRADDKDKIPHLSIFAAGDCCCLEWPERESAHWFQMRLWSQAREMGLFTAKCMADSVDELSGGAFDLFVHATRFFSHKVVLLGRFNGQGLGKSVQEFVSTHLVLNSDDDVRLQGGAVAVGSGEGSSFPIDRRHEAIKVRTGNSKFSGDVQVLVRTSPGAEYIKVILVGGRVRGAMLVGDTGLEETFENLILSGTNVSDVGADLLSLDVDVEDFFD